MRLAFFQFTLDGQTHYGVSRIERDDRRAVLYVGDRNKAPADGVSLVAWEASGGGSWIALIDERLSKAWMLGRIHDAEHTEALGYVCKVFG